MRFASSRGASSPQLKPAPSEEARAPEPASAKSQAPPPPVETAVKNDKAVKAPAADAAEKNESAAVPRFTVKKEVAKGLLLSAVVPDYPTLARQTKVEGLVTLKANISKEGKVESLSVVKGHPLLIGSALEAAKEMRYKPYLQNGEPVAISAEIDFLFTLKPQ
jgi:TonB family protein